MRLPERLDGSFREPFSIEAWTENVAKHHGAEEQGHRKFFVENRRKDSPVHAPAHQFPESRAGSLQHAGSPCTAKFRVARRIRDQVRHDLLLQLRLALT